MCKPATVLGEGAAATETHLTQLPPGSSLDATTASKLRAFVPDSQVCVAAFDLVSSAVPLAIVHHSIRVYLFAQWLAEQEQSPHATDDLLFVACMMHDIGASAHAVYNGSQRFEVEGADAASELLREHGKSEADAHQVWSAIALHTSPGIAERISPFVRLVRLGVLIDFRPATREAVGATAYAANIELQLPRLEIEKVLGEAVVAQAVLNPAKAPAASWPNNLYKSHLENPGWSGVNRAF